eukprot:403356544
MHQRSGGQHHSHGHHGYSQRQHGPQATVISDYIDKNLQENVALVLLDKNFQTCENIALYAVTDLMKEYMRELGKEIKSYTELNGRTESNLIDTLNALYNYDMPKEKLIEHMESRGRELSLTPYKYGYLEEHQFAMDRKVRSKMDAIQSIFSGGDQIGSTPANINTSQLPEYTKKLKTMSSIPSHLLNVLPSKLTFMADQTLAERETNPAYERMQRVQFKREIENSIQKVSEIQIDLSQQVNAQKQEQQVNLVEGAVEELKQEQAAEDVQMKDAEELPQPPINGIDEQQLPKDEANTQPKELVQQQEEESMQIDTSTIQAQQQQVEEQQKEVKQINSAKKKKEKKQPETVQNPNELWSFGVGQVTSQNLDNLFNI